MGNLSWLSLVKAATAGFALISEPVLSVESTSQAMSYEKCIAVIAATGEKLNAMPINIVFTDDIRMVKFLTSDGAVMVTCSRKDNIMVTTLTKE